jgi:TetR/AcrR family transcriptional regulator
MSREPVVPETAEPDPGARPTQVRILEVAIAEFSAKGFAGARIEQIARIADVNKQVLYYYFKSKEALYDAVLARMSAISIAAVERARNEVAERGFISAVLRRTDAVEERHWGRWRRLWMWEALEGRDRETADEDHRRGAWRETVATLARAQQAGELDPTLDTEMLLLAVEAILNYPLLLPRVAEMITGLEPSDEAFAHRQRDFLEQLLGRLAGS